MIDPVLLIFFYFFGPLLSAMLFASLYISWLPKQDATVNKAQLSLLELSMTLHFAGMLYAGLGIFLVASHLYTSYFSPAPVQ